MRSAQRFDLAEHQIYCDKSESLCTEKIVVRKQVTGNLSLRCQMMFS